MPRSGAAPPGAAARAGERGSRGRQQQAKDRAGAYVRVPAAALGLWGEPPTPLLSPAAFKVLAALCANLKGEPLEEWSREVFPSRREIARLAGIRPRHVTACLRELEAADLVKVVGRTRGKAGKGNSYRVHFPDVELWSKDAKACQLPALPARRGARVAAPQCSTVGAPQCSKVAAPECSRVGAPQCSGLLHHSAAGTRSTEPEAKEPESAARSAHARDFDEVWNALRRYPGRRDEDEDRAALAEVLPDIREAFPSGAAAGIDRSLAEWEQSKTWRENNRGEDVGDARFARPLADWLRRRRYREHPPSVFRPGDPRRFDAAGAVPPAPPVWIGIGPEIFAAQIALEAVLPEALHQPMRDELSGAADGAKTANEALHNLALLVDYWQRKAAECRAREATTSGPGAVAAELPS